MSTDTALECERSEAHILMLTLTLCVYCDYVCVSEGSGNANLCAGIEPLDPMPRADMRPDIQPFSTPPPRWEAEHGGGGGGDHGGGGAGEGGGGGGGGMQEGDGAGKLSRILSRIFTRLLSLSLALVLGEETSLNSQ
jgi:uncharacterized membrane protein YgcG